MSTINLALSVRKAELPDLRELLAVQLRAYHVHTTWLAPEQIPPLNETIEGVQKDFQNKTFLVAIIDGRIVGSVRYGIKSGVCLLERLSVDLIYQKRGVGKELVIAVEKQVYAKAHKIYLETGLLAEGLIRFYSRLGYSGEAVLRNHYGNFDWIVLSKFVDNQYEQVQQIVPASSGIRS